MNKTLIIIVCLFCSNFSYALDNYSIYLVRHAEKVTNKKNPDLSVCGKERATQLASILSMAHITAIYSTSYERTMQTAKPIAELNEVKIENYQPKELKELSTRLKNKQEHALVIGHSNTTPRLVELLSNQKVLALTERDYQHLYQVQFTNDLPTLTVFKQPLNCRTHKE